MTYTIIKVLHLEYTFSTTSTVDNNNFQATIVSITQIWELSLKLQVKTTCDLGAI